jgi:DNA-binding GntR family transcriptional regulator
VRPDANDPRAPYLQVADDLRAAITDGTFKPGQRLPSGRELARRYGVAPMTANHAVRVLRDERLVVSYQGRGVFVADRAEQRPASPAVEDPALVALRDELTKLADRVTRLESLVSGTGPEAST